MTNVPDWLRDFMRFLASHPREMTAREFAARVHDALVIAEAEKYATPSSRFSFTIEGATDEEIAEIRSHLTEHENSLVEIFRVDPDLDDFAMRGGRCVVRQGIFDRWYIFHPVDPSLAWSGQRWTFCRADGLPAGIQVCNFETEQDALDYCRENGLQPLSAV